VVKINLESKQVDVDSKTGHGRTALSHAASRGHVAALEMILETGRVDANSQDGNGWTPVHYAASNEHQAALDSLRESICRLAYLVGMPTKAYLVIEISHRGNTAIAQSVFGSREKARFYLLGLPMTIIGIRDALSTNKETHTLTSCNS
jgi:ankyrin repeat protein